MFAPLIMSGGSAMEGWPGNRRQDTNEHHLLFLYSNGRYRIVKCLYIYIYIVKSVGSVFKLWSERCWLWFWNFSLEFERGRKSENILHHSRCVGSVPTTVTSQNTQGIGVPLISWKRLAVRPAAHMFPIVVGKRLINLQREIRVAMAA